MAAAKKELKNWKRVGGKVGDKNKEGFTLILLIKPPADVGAFYYFNSLTNPNNQP